MLQILIKFIKLILPLFKEFGLTDIKRNPNYKAQLFILTQVVVLCALTIYVYYSIDQAKRNIDLHAALIKRTDKLVEERDTFKQKSLLYTENLASCEDRIVSIRQNQAMVNRLSNNDLNK